MNTIAYIALIFIWSTTPIAVKWSAVEVSFAGGIFWRILLAAVLAFAILKARGEALFPTKKAWQLHSLAAIGIAPTFLLVYWGVQFVPSAMVSVLFSTSPFLIGLLSLVFLGKQVFTRARLLGLGLSLAGVVVIFIDQLSLSGSEAIAGLAAIITAVALFAASSLWLQNTANIGMSNWQTTSGGLIFSTPPLGLAWWLSDGSMPFDASLIGGTSIIYLAVIGSLVGFYLYYFLLHRISAYVVSTVAMISPVFALLIGQFIAGEALGVRLLWGAAMVLLGLALYHSAARGFALLFKR